MSEAATHARAVILGYLAETGWSASKLAREAGLRPTTLTRFLNRADYPSVPNTTTLIKLQRAVDAWRAARHRANPRSQPANAEHRGRFVHDPEQLAWLRIWDEMSPLDRGRAVLVLRALAAANAKSG